MGFLEEKENMWKKAEERAKAMEKREEEVKKAARDLKKKREPEEIQKAADRMHKAYGDYGDEVKKPGILRKVLDWLGF